MGHRGIVVRAVLAVALLGTLAAPAGASVPARAQQAQSPPPKSYIVVDASSGRILLADHPHEALPPASTAKVMTAITAIERLPADAVVTVSDLAAAQPASRINMVAGQQWALGDALASLMMVSANDAAYAIAETAGGDLAGFARAMTETATRLGMKDSTFADPAGFDDEASFGGGPRMSAYDIAIVTRNALTVPELALWSALPRYEFVDPTGLQRSLTNHNKMLAGGSRSYEGATGMKTGFTNNAGHTFVATAKRGGRTLIAVVLDTYDTYGWAAALLDQGFAMREDQGSRQRLPKVAVSPYGERLGDREAFLLLTRGSTTTTTTAPPPTTTAGALAPLAAAAPPDTAAPGSARPQPDDSGAPDDSDGSDGAGLGSTVVSLRVLGAVLVVLLVTAFVMRRRAVRRRRARRRVQYDRAARMRSGGLTVVDGRYRTGLRLGPPVESHVRVHRIPSRDEHLG